MAWRRPGDKLLSEPMMVSLLTHICVTRPQWVKGMSHRSVNRHLALVPLTVFRSDSKFNKNLECFSLKYAQPMTKKFCTCHNSYTLKTCAAFLCYWSSIFQTRARQILNEIFNSIEISLVAGVPDLGVDLHLWAHWGLRLFCGSPPGHKHEIEGFVTDWSVTREMRAVFHVVCSTTPGLNVLNLRALKLSSWYKNCIFQCVGKLCCVEFSKVPFEILHTEYLSYAFKNVWI